jgi:hypothetical protein
MDNINDAAIASQFRTQLERLVEIARMMARGV